MYKISIYESSKLHSRTAFGTGKPVVHVTLTEHHPGCTGHVDNLDMFWEDVLGGNHAGALAQQKKGEISKDCTYLQVRPCAAVRQRERRRAVPRQLQQAPAPIRRLRIADAEAEISGAQPSSCHICSVLRTSLVMPS